MNKQTREEWIKEVAQIWATKLGEKAPDENLTQLAEAMADSYFDDPLWHYTPAEAVDEEISCF